MTQELEQIFIQAAEIAKKLPKNLQEAAFNRAVDELRRGGNSPTPSRSNTKGIKQTDSSNDVLSQIDRTKYPDIGTTGRTADRALKILQIAATDHDLDGLTAAQIASILTSKFRLTTSPNAVNVALDRETQRVHITTNGSGKKVFRLMAPGETYLAALRSGENPDKQSATLTRKKVSKKTKGRRSNSTQSASSDKKNAKPFAGRPGPMVAISRLIEAGLFDTPRAIAVVQKELKDRLGFSFSLQELSPALVRLIRNNTLGRDRNTNGQYEYRKK